MEGRGMFFSASCLGNLFAGYLEADITSFIIKERENTQTYRFLIRIWEFCNSFIWISVVKVILTLRIKTYLPLPSTFINRRMVSPSLFSRFFFCFSSTSSAYFMSCRVTFFHFSFSFFHFFAFSSSFIYSNNTQMWRLSWTDTGSIRFKGAGTDVACQVFAVQRVSCPAEW